MICFLIRLIVRLHRWNNNDEPTNNRNLTVQFIHICENYVCHKTSIQQKYSREVDSVNKQMAIRLPTSPWRNRTGSNSHTMGTKMCRANKYIFQGKKTRILIVISRHLEFSNVNLKNVCSDSCSFSILNNKSKGNYSIASKKIMLNA